MSTDLGTDILDGFESLEIPLPEAARAPGESDGDRAGRDAGPPGGRRAIRRTRCSTCTGGTTTSSRPTWPTSLSAAGFAFYALDLRRYGRSLRLGQLRGFIADLTEYDQELSAAADLIAADHQQLTLLGHSTGGLTATLWAADHPGAGGRGDPQLAVAGPAGLGHGPRPRRAGDRRPGWEPADRGAAAAGLRASTRGRSTSDQEGEWDYDTELKTSPSPAIRVGWLRAVLQGHQKVAAGLGLPMPVLVMTSAKTDFARKWHDGLHAADTVLDVEQIARRATKLGRHVTIVKFDGGLHDLFLSRAGGPHAGVRRAGALVRGIPARALVRSFRMLPLIRSGATD